MAEHSEGGRGSRSRSVSFDGGSSGKVQNRRPSTAHGELGGQRGSIKGVAGGGEPAGNQGSEAGAGVGDRRPSTASLTKQGTLGKMLGIVEENPAPVERAERRESTGEGSIGSGAGARQRKSSVVKSGQKTEHPLTNWGPFGLQASWQGMKGARTSSRGYPM
jgi:hypothetical protein